MDVKTIGIACDHAGYPLKKYVVQYLEEHGYKYKDYGTYSDLSCDYPDFAHALAEGLESGEVYPGIGICGSGEGMAITLNKHQGVRGPDASSTTRRRVKYSTPSSRPPSREDATSAAWRRFP